MSAVFSCSCDEEYCLTKPSQSTSSQSRHTCSQEKATVNYHLQDSWSRVRCQASPSSAALWFSVWDLYVPTSIFYTCMHHVCIYTHILHVLYITYITFNLAFHLRRGSCALLTLWSDIIPQENATEKKVDLIFIWFNFNSAKHFWKRK